MPLADDQHSSTNDSSLNRRRHADWCLARNQNKARAHALAKSADLKPSQSSSLQLGLQLIDRTKDFTRSSRKNFIPIAWEGVRKLRPKAGRFKCLHVHTARQGQRSWWWIQNRFSHTVRLRSQKNGSDRLSFTASYEALLSAKDIDHGCGAEGLGKGRHKLSWIKKFKVMEIFWLGKPKQWLTQPRR